MTLLCCLTQQGKQGPDMWWNSAQRISLNTSVLVTGWYRHKVMNATLTGTSRLQNRDSRQSHPHRLVREQTEAEEGGQEREQAWVV